jgi:hypothetical protein
MRENMASGDDGEWFVGKEGSMMVRMRATTPKIKISHLRHYTTLGAIYTSL